MILILVITFWASPSGYKGTVSVRGDFRSKPLQFYTNWSFLLDNLNYHCKKSAMGALQ